METIIHLLCKSAMLDAERLSVSRYIGNRRSASAIEAAIIRKAERLCALLTIKYLS